MKRSNRWMILLLGSWLAATAFTTTSAESLVVDGVNIRIAFDEAEFDNGRDTLMAWVKRSADIVGGYYSGFPVPRLTVLIRAVPGSGVKNGTTYGVDGGLIRMTVGRGVTEAELRNDWVLVHEMTHLALPDTGLQHSWLSEGLATYVEGIARAQAGNRTEEDVWSEQMRSMPKGLPRSGDEGLDNTHTWGRTYWGGALFCLMADVEIRRQTQDKLGLQDAMRAVVRKSGGLGTDWPIERVLETGDAAVGGHVLEQLYAEWKGKPMTPDLETLWHDLGVERDGNSVRLRDDAPLAHIRHAIMRSRP